MKFSTVVPSLSETTGEAWSVLSLPYTVISSD